MQRTPKTSPSAEPIPSDDPIALVQQEGIRLPSFPDILARLESELSKEEVHFGRIAGLVRMDPVVSGQILRLANSAWYSRGGQPVQDLSRAMVRLGLPLTRDLVQALIVPSLFSETGGVLDQAVFWKHSFAVALQAQSLGRMLNLPREQMELIWTAGILHDVGAMLWDLLATAKLQRFVAALSGDEGATRNYREIEKAWLGVDHAALGAAFLQRTWKLPDEIVRLVGAHEDPVALEGEPRLHRPALCIHVAEVLCEEKGVHWLPGTVGRAGTLGPVFETMGLGEDDLAGMVEEVGQVVNHADAMLASTRR